MGHHPALIEETQRLLHSINDRLGAVCERIKAPVAGEEVPRISIRDGLNDIQLALEAERREMDDEGEDPRDAVTPMDRD